MPPGRSPTGREGCDRMAARADQLAQPHPIALSARWVYRLQTHESASCSALDGRAVWSAEEREDFRHRAPSRGRPRRRARTRGPAHRPSRACVRRTGVGTTKESATCGTRRSRPVRAESPRCRVLTSGSGARTGWSLGRGPGRSAAPMMLARGPGHRDAHMDQMRLANGCAVRLRVKMQRAWSISVCPWDDGGHGFPPSRSG